MCYLLTIYGYFQTHSSVSVHTNKNSFYFWKCFTNFLKSILGIFNIINCKRWCKWKVLQWFDIIFMMVKFSGNYFSFFVLWIKATSTPTYQSRSLWALSIIFFNNNFCHCILTSFMYHQRSRGCTAERKSLCCFPTLIV